MKRQMLKQLTANPLEVFRIRRAIVPPIHFEYADLVLPYNMKEALEKWIETHLKSRYYIGRGVAIDHDNKINYSLRVGFEEPKELSFFMLACPHLKYK
jgi:hypothetical protein